MLKRHFAIVNFLRILVDAASIAVLWNLVYYLRFHTGFFAHSGIPPYNQHLLLTIPIVVILYLSRVWMGVYKPMRVESTLQLLRKQVESILIGYLFIVFFFYFSTRTPYTRVLLLLFFFVLMGGLILSNFALVVLLRTLRSKGYNLRRCGILGTGKTALKLLEDIRRNSYWGIECTFLIDDKPHLDGRMLRGVRVYGGVEQLIETALENRIDEFYLSQNKCNPEKLRPLLNELQMEGVTLRIQPDWHGLAAFGSPSTITIGSSVLFTASDSPLSGANHILKTLFDRLVAFFLLLLFSIPMLIIAILIKATDKGPVLYKQPRMGLDNKVFNILKFRTMVHTPDVPGGWTVPNDRRRTRIGAFLRSTSLDELPQLINVIRGQMSLVGPRPEQPHFVRQFSADYKKYMFRHKVKAGMTGWAQIHGYRGDTSLRKRLQYDLYYIQNWSIWLDLLILLRTPFHVIRQKNAY